MQNKVKEEMIGLGIIDEKSISNYFPFVRDRKDVSVLKCNKSGVIFLSRTDHMEETYYEEKSGTTYWNDNGRSEALVETGEDDERRFEQFKNIVTGKKYCDIGCGLGGVLERMKAVASQASGVELQSEIRNYLNSIGLNVAASIDEMQDNQEVVSMFHVFEHIIEPGSFLKKLNKKMKMGAKLIIEVPHANDALIKTYNLESFKAFTFWSEHLVLHTRKSLATYLQKNGFGNVKVSGFQRYPLSNHLYWLKDGKPGGQKVLAHLNDKQLNEQYAHLLDKIDETDTIIAVAEKTSETT